MRTRNYDDPNFGAPLVPRVYGVYQHKGTNNLGDYNAPILISVNNLNCLMNVKMICLMRQSHKYDVIEQ